MTHPLKTAPTQPDRQRRQMSHGNACASPFDGRGRTPAQARRAHVHHGTEREVFLRRWSLLMIASFDSREACAVHFGVSFQTACNWFDALNAPYGHHVDRATRSLDRYAQIMRGDR
ncbi:MAG: hypothetical protein ACK41U_12405 [Paracoccus sp. (in: a-proteobacteria)]|uniref:hypothetical protein n=1 Tax=Paracoccus sp. TaxID=267 RepID=UPI003918A8BF